MPSITDAMVSLVVVTVHKPSSSAIAATGSMPKVNGSRRTRPMIPPSPGTAPIQMPSRQPSNKYPMAGH